MERSRGREGGEGRGEWGVTAREATRGGARKSERLGRWARAARGGTRERGVRRTAEALVRKGRTVVIASAPGKSSLLVVLVVVLAGEVAGDPHAVAIRVVVVRRILVVERAVRAVGGLVAPTPVPLPVAPRRHPDVGRHDERLPRLPAEPPARVVL